MSTLRNYRTQRSRRSNAIEIYSSVQLLQRHANERHDSERYANVRHANVRHVALRILRTSCACEVRNVNFMYVKVTYIIMTYLTSCISYFCYKGRRDVRAWNVT